MISEDTALESAPACVWVCPSDELQKDPSVFNKSATTMFPNPSSSTEETNSTECKNS